MKKTVFAIIIFLFTTSYVFSQSNEIKGYAGFGFGFDYGGLGGKVEYLPAKNFGAFAGLGYNFAGLGWNLGATYKILPDKKVSPNLMLMYGYNATLIVKGASEYDVTSYGFTFGGNLDIQLDASHKLSIGLFVPIRSNEFNDKYDAAKKDSRIKFDSPLLPIAISVGYNYAF